MKTEWYIARRLRTSEEQMGKQQTRTAVRLAMLGIILGMVVMTITLCIVIGFKHTIREKVTGFGGHIEVVNFDNNSTYEMQPIYVDSALIEKLLKIDNVVEASEFGTKPGIIKTDNAFEGIVYKGCSKESEFFSRNLVEGRMPTEPGEVLISQTLSKRLGIAVGEAMYCYFIEERVRARKYTVSGLYETSLNEYDRLFVIGQIEEVRRLNGWSSDQASGIEICIARFNRLEDTAYEVYKATANRFDEEGNGYYTQTVEDRNPAIFSWLRLLDMNVWVIIILMLSVSGFSIASGLIILILSNVQFIGTMKALGARNGMVRRIFVYQAAFIVGRGMAWGNAIGLGLALVQQMTHLIPLDAASYYVSYVPIAFPWWGLIGLNVVTFVVSVLILIVPSAVVSHISPAEVMRYE